MIGYLNLLIMLLGVTTIHNITIIMNTKLKYSILSYYFRFFADYVALPIRASLTVCPLIYFVPSDDVAVIGGTVIICKRKVTPFWVPLPGKSQAGT
jgi:hypothetical protein